MAFTSGTKLGSYEITGPLGAGGMGEVYRAWDSKLKRDVAIKVLPEAFARDPDRIARFQREAEALASLNHPSIGSIYDLSEAGDSRFLVLELVEGETLAERIARGAIPVDEALPIARQIAEAMEAAHERGIIHRDLKPANIKIAPGGRVKVLDFGLAKIREAAGAASNLSNSPTLMTAKSMPGMIVGTVSYMSPEQAKGMEADRGSDVWGFGCVLFEMLTGKQAFAGDTIAEALAGILKGEPQWLLLPPETPEAVRRLLRRCLERESELRLHDLRAARIEIHEAQHEPVTATPVTGRATGRRKRRLWIVPVTILAAAAGAFFGLAFRPAAPAAEARLEITTPPTTDPDSLAISPDGRQIVFVATSEGRPGLWLRPLDSNAARVLKGTEGASFPFFSPDSRSIAFFADNKIKRIDIDGGSLQVLANSNGWFGPGTWSPFGRILYSPVPGRPILRVSATGGPSTPVTRIEERRQTAGHGEPAFLPDGRHFLYTIGQGEDRGIWVGELDRPETQRRLIDAATTPSYIPPGYVLFVRDSALFAQKFDPDQLELSGNPIPIAGDVSEGVRPGVRASDTGTIVYRAGNNPQYQIAWFNREGREIGRVGAPDPNIGGLMPSISPDGRRLLTGRIVGGNIDVWILELARGVLDRFTFDPSNDVFPVWAPDGDRIAFSSTRIKGAHDIYTKDVNGASSESLLLASSEDKFVTDWSADGQHILYFTYGPQTQHNIWAMPVNGDKTAFAVVETEFEERNAQFSPNGKWVAYQSNESGRFEIYAVPFPGPGAKLRISTNGGAQARWRHDGKELFYIALDGQLMSAPIQFSNDEKIIEPGKPIPLFLTKFPRAVEHLDGQQYVVSADGQRFLINTPVGDVATAPISVILNWKPKP